jgi:hypothetical protein
VQLTDQAIQGQVLKELRELRAYLNVYAKETAQSLDNLESLAAPRPVLVISRRKSRQS